MFKAGDLVEYANEDGDLKRAILTETIHKYYKAITFSGRIIYLSDHDHWVAVKISGKITKKISDNIDSYIKTMKESSGEASW